MNKTHDLAYYKEAKVNLREQIAETNIPHLKRELQKAVRFADKRIKQIEDNIFRKG